MTKRKDQRTMDLLSSMNQQQMQQFMAANLLAIGVIMKKHGLTEIEISPTDYALLEQGESLEPIPTVEGGMIYRFEKAPLPLAKREVPGFVAGTTEALSTSRAEYDSAWTPGSKTNAAGWYWARPNKGSEDVEKLYFDGREWQRHLEGGVGVTVPTPFQVRRLADQGQ
jgi:hypothetical protein